jgi:hypothetical protein
MYTQDDYQELKARGISEDEIEKQLLQFRNGFPYLPISRPAGSGDGILTPREETLNDFVNLYESKALNENFLKFVPASGAATRMFRDLYAYLDNNEESGETDSFIKGLPAFAFYDELERVMKKDEKDIGTLSGSGDYASIIKGLLDEGGLNYANLPKGLLSFHKYNDETRTAFEEHLVEGAMYCRGKDNEVRIHMTVSPEHRGDFEKVLSRARENLEDRFDIKYVVDFSVQKPSTDTIAVDSSNNPFRDKNGRLVFRPGGHGALLENLAALDSDIIFIKNIDNVVPDRLKDETIRYKKALGGMLLSFRERIFDYLHILNDNPGNSFGVLEEIRTFLEEELCVISPWGIDQWTNHEKRDYLFTKLNRPIRVCGMVRNVGEPGGGPFWVKNSDGSVSLQIVESSQINLSNPLMRKLFDASTHFNPVDLVCSVKDFRGNSFNLRDYRDPDTGFISSKSLDGRELKALELPGLWNGAMANWITVFVEVPLSTFNPVKTINDLLRPQHAGK